NLFSEETISGGVPGVYRASDSNSGKLTLGGYGPFIIAETVNYMPITNTYSSTLFWGIDQLITYGGKTILPSTAGIVDTGTTLILIAT
ncbi:hypothetical protein BKA82DRAFT_3926594, partial [Pisolithus tinctorius]